MDKTGIEQGQSLKGKEWAQEFKDGFDNERLNGIEHVGKVI